MRKSRQLKTKQVLLAHSKKVSAMEQNVFVFFTHQDTCKRALSFQRRRHIFLQNAVGKTSAIPFINMIVSVISVTSIIFTGGK